MALIDEQVNQSIRQREDTASQFLAQAKEQAAAPPAGLPQQNVQLQGEGDNRRGLLSGASGELGQIFNFFSQIKQRKQLRERAERFSETRRRIVNESGATVDERADPVTRAKFSLQAADALGDPELTSRALDAVQKAMILQASRNLATQQQATALAKQKQAEATTAKTEAETPQVVPQAEAITKKRIAEAKLAEGKLADLKPAADDRATNAAARKLSSEAAMKRSLALENKEANEKARKIASPALQKQVSQQLVGMPFMEGQDLDNTNVKLAVQQMSFHVANSVEAQMRVAPGTPFPVAFQQGFNDFRKFMSPDERGFFKKLLFFDKEPVFDVAGAVGAGGEQAGQDAESKINKVTTDFHAGKINRAEAEKLLKELGVKD